MESELQNLKKSYQNRTCVDCTCENCNKIFKKPQSEINRNLKRGRKNFCSIKCSVEYRNKFKLTEKQKEHRINFAKNWAGNSKISSNRKDEFSIFRETFRRAKMHAKSRTGEKTEFTITLQDLKNQWELQQGKCIYTNLPINLPEYNKTYNVTELASLDRIDSSKGYTPNNIQFICSCINFMKHTLTDLETKKFLKKISSYTSTFIEDQTISSSQNEMSDALTGN